MKIALAVASLGIAATQYCYILRFPAGKTAHTIPLDLDINETSVCVVLRNSDKIKILAEYK